MHFETVTFSSLVFGPIESPRHHRRLLPRGDPASRGANKGWTRPTREGQAANPSASRKWPRTEK
eukprot:4785045-Alexandrium_andersonii.AAC.1